MESYAYPPLEPRFEIWNGESLIREPASPDHEYLVGTLHLIVRQYADKNRLGRIYLSNTAVYLHGNCGNKDFVMPDLSFVSLDRLHIVRSNGIWGPPDLTIEVISPGIRNMKRDIEDKYRLYEQSGVREYWIVDYFEQTIYYYELASGTYRQADRSRLFEGIDLSGAFDERL